MNRKTKDFIDKEQRLIDMEFEIIDKLIKIRSKQNLSQRDVEKLTSIKQPSLVSMEKRKHSPQLNTLIKLLDTYGYKLDLKKK